MDKSEQKGTVEYWVKHVTPVYGGSKKDPKDMTEEEKEFQTTEIIRRIKEWNFSHGQPIAYEIGGRTVNEYEDGTIVFTTAPK